MPPKKNTVPAEVLYKAYELMYTAKAMTDIYEENKDVASKYVHATSRGHEAIQIAVGMQLESPDWGATYYRYDARLLGIGMIPYELMLQLHAKKDDPFSGVRSYYCHHSLRRNDRPRIPHQASATGMRAIPTTGVAMSIQYLEKEKLARDKSVVCLWTTSLFLDIGCPLLPPLWELPAYPLQMIDGEF